MDSLRSSIISILKAQRLNDIQVASQCICEKLSTIIKEDMTVGFYMAMPEEVQIESLRHEVKDKVRCAIPKILGKGIMTFHQLDDTTKIAPNHWGILEVVDANIVKPEEFDIIIVPMVGFDEQMHRIGHGAGYYDRYLAKTSALKIGVAFELQKQKDILVSSHDVDMDIIFTETQIYHKFSY